MYSRRRLPCQWFTQVEIYWEKGNFNTDLNDNDIFVISNNAFEDLDIAVFHGVVSLFSIYEFDCPFGIVSSLLLVSMRNTTDVTCGAGSAQPYPTP
ncbi:hypothetical protein AM593_00512, partial [Mytilus galloprovincialis]